MTNAEIRRVGGWRDAENVGSVRELGLWTVVTPAQAVLNGLGTRLPEWSRNGPGTETGQGWVQIGR